MLVIIGPSGTGKSTAIRLLHATGIVVVVPTWTTRPPRPGELKNSVEHHFVSEKAFKKAEAEGTFLETVQMFDLPYWYGMPVVDPAKATKIPLVVLRAALIDNFYKYYTHAVVYQIEDTVERVRQRLEARKIHGEALGSRLEHFQKEVTAGRALADRTFVNNGKPEELVQQIINALEHDFPLAKA